MDNPRAMLFQKQARNWEVSSLYSNTPSFQQYKNIFFSTAACLGFFTLSACLFSQATFANEIEARTIAEEVRTLVVNTAQVEEPKPTNTAANSNQNKTTSATDAEDTFTGNKPQDDKVAEGAADDLPEAKSVDLAEPITNEELKAAEEPKQKESSKPKAETAPTETPATTPSTEPASPATEPDATPGNVPQTGNIPQTDNAPTDNVPPTDGAPSTEAEAKPKKPKAPKQEQAEAVPEEAHADTLLILGTKIPPSTATRLAWSPTQSFEGLNMPTPVLVVNGAQNGPTLCVTAAVHGDELNGIEIVRRVLYGLKPEELSGAVIGVPIVNLQGFRRNSRYLADRRDLNRYFPGNPTGSSASRMAYSFFNSVISHCDVLVDLHTGSFDRTNLPQLRADLRNKEIAKLTHNFGATVVLHGVGSEGTLRRAAAEHGIPSVTLEAGGPSHLQETSVSHGVAGIQTLLNGLGMIKRFSFWGKPEPVYYQSSWIRVNDGGILFSKVKLGEKVKANDVLGTVTDPITNVSHDVVSPHEGRILGMALNQVMLPGFAAYHIGIATPDETKAVPPEDTQPMNEHDVSETTKQPMNQSKIEGDEEPGLSDANRDKTSQDIDSRQNIESE